MKYTTKYVCECGFIEVTDPEEKRRIEESYEPVIATCPKCGKDMVGLSAAEQAEKDGLFYCHAKEDFCMTEKCPKIDCDVVDKCHRRGFFQRF